MTKVTLSFLSFSQTNKTLSFYFLKEKIKNAALLPLNLTKKTIGMQIWLRPGPKFLLSHQLWTVSFSVARNFVFVSNVDFLLATTPLGEKSPFSDHLCRVEIPFESNLYPFRRFFFISNPKNHFRGGLGEIKQLFGSLSLNPGNRFVFV